MSSQEEFVLPLDDYNQQDRDLDYDLINEPVRLEFILFTNNFLKQILV